MGEQVLTRHVFPSFNPCLSVLSVKSAPSVARLF